MKKKEPKYKVGDTVVYTSEVDGLQYEFKIGSIRTESYVDDDLKEIECIVYHNEDYHEFLYESEIEGLSRNYIKITKESLIENGWKELDFIGLCYEKQYTLNERTFYCEMRPFSNTVGREWNVHIDNVGFETVGTMDVATFGQIDRFIELLSE